MPETRLIKWECPDCGAVEVQQLDISNRCIVPPNPVETIPLHCEACERKRLGFGQWRKPAGSGPVNRVFDRRVDAPEY